MIAIHEKYTFGFSSTPSLPQQFMSGQVKKQYQQDQAYLKKKPKALNKSLNFKNKNVYGNFKP